MIPAYLLNRNVLLGVGAALSLGIVFSYGYYKGYDRAEQVSAQKLLKASEKAVEAEKALARAAVRKAEEASQRLSQGRLEASEIRRQYEDAKPHEVDPVNCVSDDQRRVLSELARSTQ